MIRQVRIRERTLRSWYLNSSGTRGSRSQFFALLDSCTSEKLMSVVETDLCRPVTGSLRTLASIREYSRRDPPSLEELRTTVPNEQTLQWLFLYRGYLQFEHERVIERELPVSPADVAREGSVDVLAFDGIANQPILVELKQVRANDSLTGALLEVLAHWAFHMRYLAEFREQLMKGSVSGANVMKKPSVVIAAPKKFFLETVRRSGDSRRHHEVRTAAAIVKCLKDTMGLKIRLLAISDDWQQVGPAFGVEEWLIPADGA
jgi:hypothetical protein